MKRLWDWISVKKFKKIDLVFLILALLCAFVWDMKRYQVDGLFQKDIIIDNPYLAKQDVTGNTYVVDQEHGRILKLGQNKQVVYSIRGNNKEEDTISYVGDIAVAPNGNLFVEEHHWGGLYVDREAILIYDSQGKYLATCYDAIYDNEYVDKRKIYGMTVYGDFLYYVILQDNALHLQRMNLKTYEITLLKEISYANAYNSIYDICLLPEQEKMYALDKRNQVIRFSEKGNQVLYNSAKDKTYQGKVAFYSLAVDGNEQIYLTDIKGGHVFNLNPTQGKLEVLLQNDGALTLNWTEQENGKQVLSVVYGDQLCEMSTQGDILYSGHQLEKGESLRNRTILLYVLLAVFILCVLWLVLRLVICLAGIKLSKVTRSGLSISAVVVVVVIIIVSQLMSSFRNVYTDEVFEKLLISAHSVSTQLDADVIEDISAPEHFMSASYNELMTTLERAIDRTYDFNQDIYCNILKYENQEAFSIAYLDQSTGTYYPLDELETKEVQEVYETGNDVLNAGKADVAGSFAYVKTPVYDDNGDVIAVVAVGSDTSIVEQQIAQMQRTVLITLVTVVLMLLFLFGEILGFLDSRSTYQKTRHANPKAVPLHMVRLIIFITFVAFNMATSFLPVYAAGLVGDQIGIPHELAVSLPVTLNLAFMGLMSVFCAPLMTRFSFRNIAILSALICLTGDMTIFLNHDYRALVLGLILNGIGVGLITNCINMFIASSDDMDIKRDGFSIFNSSSTSGTNIGSMFGASLAGYLSQQQVFGVSSATWVLVAVLFLLFGKHIAQAPKVAVEQALPQKAGGSFMRFMVAPRVWGYILCIQIPYIMLNSFIFYYVPLYGAEQGFNESTTCLLLMVNSLCSVFLGVALTNFFMEKFRQMTIYISTVMSLLSLLLFAANPTVGVLIVVLLIMGVSRSFGVSSKCVYFTELPQVKEYGEENAMGVYNLTDNVGESVGPMIFSKLMSSSNLMFSMLQFVGVIGVLSAIYGFGSLVKKKQREVQ